MTRDWDFVVAIVLVVVLIVGVLMWGGDRKDDYSKECERAGGIAFIAKGARICLVREAVIKGVGE